MDERLKQQLDFALEIDQREKYLPTDPPVRTREK